MRKSDIPLLPHQKKGVKYLLENSNCMLCDDMGMGKTRTVIEAVLTRNLFPILVVCPASLKLNWKLEFKKWGGIDTEIDDITKDVVIINYDVMKKYEWEVLNGNFKQVIFDESHVLKNNKSKRGKIALAWSKVIPYRILVSGTPMLNRPIELLHQIDIVGRLGVFGGREKFLSTFCGARRTRYGVNYQGFSNLGKLRSLFKRISLRRTKDMLDISLPTKDIVPVPVCELNHPVPSSFQEIERLDRHSIEHKLKASINFIKTKLESGEKIVVFVHHKSLLEKLCAEFSDVCTSIHGGQSATSRQHSIDSFQYGKKQLIICSLMASSVGLTLTSSHIAVFLEFPWSPAILNQAQDRIHRLSQTKPVTVYYLYCKGSIDEYRLNNTTNKGVVINTII